MQPLTLADLDADLADAVANDANVARFNEIAALVDKLDHRPDVSLHSAALWYAGYGLRVFPLTPRSKVPLKGSNGCLGATTDPDLINKWWAGNPHANIGLATGHTFDVVDVDGAAGHVNWSREFGDTWADLTVLGIVSTPRPGGLHLYVEKREGMRNGAGLLDGVDYRGAGGYVVAPPSVNEQGAYVWVRPLP